MLKSQDQIRDNFAFVDVIILREIRKVYLRAEIPFHIGVRFDPLIFVGENRFNYPIKESNAVQSLLYNSEGFFPLGQRTLMLID